MHNNYMAKAIYNKRATFDYHILDSFEGGLVLLGTEVRSIKAGHISLKGAFITMHHGEPFLTNATIPAWQAKNAPSDYDPQRPRKVLLKKNELKQLFSTKRTEGLTIIPISVYTKGSRIKIQVALARGKRKHHKKQILKERDIQRDIDRVIRGKDY